jgi:ferredoxin-type protein NapH
MHRHRLETGRRGQGTAHADSRSGREKKRGISPRLFVQLAAAVLMNGYAAGFAGGRIFTGPTKAVCVPVLNCYSCPGALGSCPIGALQTVLAHHRFPFYVLGTLMLFGVVLGRFVCGWLCPFGLLQDLLNKIPHPSRKPKNKWIKGADRAARYLKYLVLAVLVVLLPAFAAGAAGVSEPWFCKYLCPAGTLEGGIPHMLLQPQLRALAGALFDWKLIVLVAVILAAVLIRRPFCRYLCPLGALYALFNRFSFYQMHVDREKCVDCGACRTACPMTVAVTDNINSAECIRCGRCRDVCPTDAIRAGFAGEAPQPAPPASPAGSSENEINDAR